MSFRSQEPQRRTGGPIGGLVKLIGTGVGAAVEYHGHRKQRKAAYDSAQASPEEEHVSAGPSSQPTTIQRSTSNNLPPTYTQSTNHTSDGQLATGPPAIDEKKLQDDSSSDSEYLSDELTPIEDDEEAWQLDEVAASTEPPSYENATRETTDAFERDIVATRELNTSPIGTLLLPVIVPQRRPRNKSRGFVRAYSPVLEDVGIDQKTFLRFLKNFHSSSQANPCFSAVMVAAGIVGMVPEPIIMAVTISVQVVAGTLKELDSRRKTNNFLDRMNETLFKPAGCYAFIMKYKPDAEVKQPGGLLAKLGVKIEDVDFSASKTVAKYDAPSAEEGTSMATRLKKIRLTSGQTKGSVKMVEAAPLIYPEIDEIVYSGKDGQETFKDKAKDASKFLAGYADRRAQMQYARYDPNSALVVPESERQVKSKWSDPNHPMFTGGLVGLVSGGYIDAGKYRAEKRERKIERKELRSERKELRNERKSLRKERRRSSRQGYEDTSPLSSRGEVISPTNSLSAQQQSQDYFSRGTGGGRYARDRATLRAGGPGGVIGAVKKIMQEDVLYLMIVPMPSEAELAEAREMIRMEKEKK